MERTIGYASVGDARVAYQVTGNGPVDLVSTPGSFVSFDVASDDPMIELFFRRLASFTRLIRFDRRGMGASDPVPLDALPHLESYAEETLAVMDAVESDQAAIMAGYDAGPMAMLLAATQPERVSALVLANTTARVLYTEDYEIGLDPDDRPDDRHGRRDMGHRPAGRHVCFQPRRRSAVSVLVRQAAADDDQPRAGVRLSGGDDGPRRAVSVALNPDPDPRDAPGAAAHHPARPGRVRRRAHSRCSARRRAWR